MSYDLEITRSEYREPSVIAALSALMLACEITEGPAGNGVSWINNGTFPAVLPDEVAALLQEAGFSIDDAWGSVQMDGEHCHVLFNLNGRKEFRHGHCVLH